MTPAEVVAARIDALPRPSRVAIDDFLGPPRPGETRCLEEVDPLSLADMAVETTDMSRLRLLRT